MKTSNPELDSALNYKLTQAVGVGAQIETTIQIPEKLEMDMFDFNVVLGNLLENAIEGVERAEEK